MATILSSFGDSIDNDKLLTLAQIAENAERYADMCEFMKELTIRKCKNNEDCNVEERNLLSVAFKNVVGQRRMAWRTLNQTDDIKEELLNNYKSIIEKELKEKCEEILSVLENHLIPHVKGKHNKDEVFYLKMSADYYRYMAEFCKGDNQYPQKAEKQYKEASVAAKAALTDTDPTRLGLALNFSVCYYEILHQPEKACKLAKDTFDAAITNLDDLTDINYKDSTLIMQLLRDNLTLWTTENEDEDDDKE